jgi:hypothetical protein
MGRSASLPDEHLLLAVDYHVDLGLHMIVSPRLISLTAGGRLVVERRDQDAILTANVATLDADDLDRAWTTVIDSGVAVDGDLRLAGFMETHGPRTSTTFRVDDGSRSTRLRIASLGSEGVYPDDPPVPADELALRASATWLIEALRSIETPDTWIPPALLLAWRHELPADREANAVAWPLADLLDLASAGRQLDQSVYERCIRLAGDEAAAVARFATTLSMDHLVEFDRSRYALAIRPIHPDETDAVDC